MATGFPEGDANFPLGSVARYDTMLDGAQGLLGDVSSILNDMDERYVIVGGWSPYLLNSSPIRHPGTRDVDVLFAQGATPDALDGVVRALLANRYVQSAKHQFQLLKVLIVGDQPFVFNVDLLHPDEAKGGLRAEFFVKHLDLRVPVSNIVPGTYQTKSIITANAGFIIEDERFVLSPVSCVLPDGREQEVTVPIMDELGLIITKCESVRNIKRPRDAFDIALAIAQARDYEKLVDDARDLIRRDSDFDSLLEKLTDELKKPSFADRIAENIDPPLRKDVETPPLVEAVRKFLGQVRGSDYSSDR